MKKITSLLSSIVATIALSAQPVTDATYSDCNNNSESIYGVLGAGKVLLVANAGTNCSICQGHAPGIAGVADNNPNTIRVWGAMTTKGGGSVNCSAINSWVSTYSWSNVFSFADNNKDWFNIATPQYTVISPFDSAIAYQGSNWNTAKSTAENLANSIGVAERDLSVQAYFTGNLLHIDMASESTNGEVIIYDLTGAQRDRFAIEGTGTYELKATLQRGIYLVRIRINGRESIKKILL
jgi:hypothetical protein